MIGKATDDRQGKRSVSMQVADFGLSRQAGDSVDTDTYGTVTHMPPELLMEGKLTKSADVYAFGVLLWEMYTGQVILSSLISSFGFCNHALFGKIVYLINNK